MLSKGKLDETPLGIEMIADFMRELQKETGQQIKSITFHQTRLVDVVTPSTIVFHNGTPLLAVREYQGSKEVSALPE